VPIRSRFLAGLLPILLLLRPAIAAEDAGNDVALSWNAAPVYVPGHSEPVRPADLRLAKPLGVVIYLHGCAGIGAEERNWAGYLASLGFLTVLPDRFARGDRGPSCWPDRNPAVHRMRREELAYALGQVKASQWAQRGNVFLMGFSEGGDAVAESELAGGAGEGVRGAVLASWTCRRFDHLSLPAEIPLLSILWDDAHSLLGVHFGGSDCADKFEGRPGLERIVLRGKGHPTFDQPAAREAVADFLRDHRAANPAVAGRP
jgi:hypothetical protein